MAYGILVLQPGIEPETPRIGNMGVSATGPPGKPPPVYTPMKSAQEWVFCTSYQFEVLLIFLTFANLINEKKFTCFIWISLITGEAEYLFMCLLAIYISSCANCLITSFGDLCARTFFFNFKSTYVRYVNYLSIIYVGSTFF